VLPLTGLARTTLPLVAGESARLCGGGEGGAGFQAKTVRGPATPGETVRTMFPPPEGLYALTTWCGWVGDNVLV